MRRRAMWPDDSLSAASEDHWRLWSPAPKELLVTRDADWGLWQVTFGEGRVPARFTFGAGDGDVHSFSDAPEQITRAAGSFSDYGFAQLLDRQWQQPEPLAVDGGEEVVWLYRGWQVVSAMPQTWAEYGSLRLRIVLSVRDEEPRDVGRLRAWRAEKTSGTSLKGGVADAVRARAVAGERDLAPEADWTWRPVPEALPLARVDVLPASTVRIGSRGSSWMFGHVPSGEVLAEWTDREFADALDVMDRMPVYVGAVDGRAVDLYRGHFTSTPFFPAPGELLAGRAGVPGEADNGVAVEALRLSVELNPDVAEPADPAGLADARTLLADLVDLPEDDSAEAARSRHIPQRVRHEVWRRDDARCVECGSQERLEFDHIIPFSKGGSNTARNVRLLCQDCNRRKAASI